MGGCRIELDIFSGRPNPTVTLNDQEALSLLERLRPERRLEDDAIRVEPGYLGYRGLRFTQVGEAVPELPRDFRLLGGALLGAGLAHRPADAAVERELLSRDGPLGRLEVEAGFFESLGREYARALELVGWPWWRWHWWPWLNPCACAPQYEPDWWNEPTRQWWNNCYNYACNYRSDNFGQPGYAAGAMYQSIDCAAVRAAAIADALIDSGDADDRCPQYGHLVALVIWPDPYWPDFHWYRKGADGSWSHKPGHTAVTNVDNSGKPITDPRTADRGPYTEFCTFMVVMAGHIKIAGTLGP